MEVLGPLFTPVMTLELSGDDFQMDQLNLPGVDPRAAKETAQAALMTMRDFLSGRIFSLRPAAYHKRFFSRRGEIRAGGWRLELDPGETLAVALYPDSGPVKRLDLDDFGRDQGRLLPRKLTARGRGFSFGLAFTDVKLELAEPSEATAR